MVLSSKKEIYPTIISRYGWQFGVQISDQLQGSFAILAFST